VKLGEPIPETEGEFYGREGPYLVRITANPLPFGMTSFVPIRYVLDSMINQLESFPRIEHEDIWKLLLP
jgi:hypothetical protein